MDLFTLQNTRICLTFSETGLLAVTDRAANVTYPVRTDGYTVVTDRVTLTGPARLHSAHDAAVTFLETTEELCVTVTYRLCGETAFFEKQITLDAPAPYTVESAVCTRLAFATPFDRIHLHDDQSLWHCPENYFLETADGGVAVGLCYPFWDTELAEDGTLSIGYTLGYRAEARLMLEPCFCGVYRKEGVERYSHGPYLGQKPMPYFPGFPEESGLHQHFVDHVIPADAGIEPELLDWGAVWAMQSYLKYRLPRHPLPEPGYFLWQNGWWAGLAEPDLQAVDVLLDSGVHDLMTQQIAFGHDCHPNTEPRCLRDTRLSPLGFPIYRGEEPTEYAQPTALHGTVEAAPTGEILGYTEHFRPPAAHAAFIRASAERGMHIGSFSMPNIAYTNGTDWLSVDENGRAHEYFHTKLSCPACDAFMEHHFDVTVAMLDSQGARFWAFDGRWQDYRELAGYHFGSIGPDRCHSPHHGHRPGDNRYKEFKNIQAFKHRLRERYPTLCLEQYYGLKRGSIWMLDDLSSDENYYETTGPDDNRLQTWHNECSRFRPHYLNYTSIFGHDYESFCYSVISALASASYAQLSRGFHMLRADERCRAFLRRWRSWASENIAYLTDRRCLFDCYGFTPLDGSAHLLGTDGYLFIFNTSDRVATGSIPLNHWIGLNAAPHTRLSVELLYPEERFLGTAEVGETLRLEIPPRSANLYRLAPTDRHTPLPEPDPNAPVIEAFQTYSSN